MLFFVAKNITVTISSFFDFFVAVLEPHAPLWLFPLSNHLPLLHRGLGFDEDAVRVAIRPLLPRVAIRPAEVLRAPGLVPVAEQRRGSPVGGGGARQVLGAPGLGLGGAGASELLPGPLGRQGQLQLGAHVGLLGGGGGGRRGVLEIQREKME